MGKRHVIQSPLEKIQAILHLLSMYFLTLQRLLISSPGPQETVTRVLLNTFLFSLYGIDLVPSVIQFPPFCLQEHPILFRSLLMALNKYTFWDLTEQAVLFRS